MTDNEILFVRSLEKSRNKSTEDDSSATDDVWDDTLLIKAYDEAVNIVQESLRKKKQNTESSLSGKKGIEKKWKVGDKCRCQYSEDLKYYEADIIEISTSTGMCTVRYIGYENEETVPLQKLKPSKGDSVRAKQLSVAVEDNADEDNNTELDTHTAGNTGKKSQSPQKKAFNPKKDQHFSKSNGFPGNDNFSSLNFPLPHLASSIIPPPPPPHIFNRLNEDENETEAMSAMLMSWYMSGYHTGYYQGLKMAKNNNRN